MSSTNKGDEGPPAENTRRRKVSELTTPGKKKMDAKQQKQHEESIGKWLQSEASNTLSTSKLWQNKQVVKDKEMASDSEVQFKKGSAKLSLFGKEMKSGE